jgi:hypothetical protein
LELVCYEDDTAYLHYIQLEDHLEAVKAIKPEIFDFFDNPMKYGEAWKHSESTVVLKLARIIIPDKSKKEDQVMKDVLAQSLDQFEVDWALREQKEDQDDQMD